MTRGTLETYNRAETQALLKDLAQEARKFRFDAAPNPCVGAAVLAGSTVIARGYHEIFGEAHAEVQAFKAARKTDVPASDWDTLVVTLEPCSSHGKTPPCVDAILATGIRRVIVGSLDSDPRHCGKGLEALERAGLEVSLITGASPLNEFSPYFQHWTSYERLRRPRPWTIAKWAQTRTGQLSPPGDVGEGRWISCAESQAEVQLLRGRVDAIVTGVGTVIEDDPRFTVRPPGNVTKPPKRVVLDSYLKTKPDSQIFAPVDPAHGAGSVHFLCLPGTDGTRSEALMQAGANLHSLNANGMKQIALREVQEWLWTNGVRRVVLEAGPTLLNRYFELGFVDQLQIYTGVVNGGVGPGLGSTVAGLKLAEREDRECGEDAVLQAFIEPQ